MAHQPATGAGAQLKMHAEEVAIDEQVVERLVAAQFPQLADLPIRVVQSTGTVNAVYRLGDDLYARLPRVQSWAQDLAKEVHWLPKLAPYLSLRVPEPIAIGQPANGFPFSWAIVAPLVSAGTRAAARRARPPGRLCAAGTGSARRAAARQLQPAHPRSTRVARRGIVTVPPRGGTVITAPR